MLDHIDQFDICYSDQVLAKIRHFADIAYFRKKNITSEVLESFINTFQAYALKISVTSQVKMGRDSHDYYLLSLCRDSRAEYLVTGDPDLLTITPYAQTQIVNLKAFVEQFA
ncbi:putative toxin-antitoxin system toxin component, PIN family [Spirosoma arcticum]